MSDTIAAIATPVGEGGIGLIRISGGDALSIASRLFRRSGKPRENGWVSQRVYYGEIVDPGSGECVDEVLLACFRAPRSYTREDVAEITSHGGVFVTSRILQLILDQGARPAEPGEFTRRAFLNGRIDLSQAEAVADLIHASSERALKSALGQLQGRLSEKVNRLYDSLMAVLAQLEAAIDFPEEGLQFQEKNKILDQVRGIQTELDDLIGSYRQGKIYREGARVALAGKPNAGKSSLFNALLHEDRAIVTPFPGTTRDMLEEKIRIRDIHVNLVDSAGLRSDPDPVEQAGISRTRSALAQADLALVLFDGSQPLDAGDETLIREVKDRPKLVLINKLDLPEKIDASRLASEFPEAEPIRISAKNHSGLQELTDAVYRRVVGEKPLRDPVIVTRERHRESFVQARQALTKARESLELNRSEEFAAADINCALERLGAVIGKTFEEDLLDKIFSDFCVGK